MLKLIFSLALSAFVLTASAQGGTADAAQSHTECVNPVLWADVPDPDVIRVGEDYYMVSTTMHLMPGVPVMHSRDLVHWETIGYVYDKLADTPLYDLEGGTVYGRGQWATSIRYHKGTFYLLFSPNDQPYRSYIYTAQNPAGPWTLRCRTNHFHDASLFIDDDDRPYVFYGTGQVAELNKDFSGLKEGGLRTTLFQRDSTETGLLEGSRVIKKDGKYYLLMISWPAGQKRREVCYRADSITGPYEKQVILLDNFKRFGYVGQGTIVDDVNGNWYGVIFQDRGGVGRVLTLEPCQWKDGWPMLGDADGRVPERFDVPLPPCPTERGIVGSDDFTATTLRNEWQWNHNPVNSMWSLTERPGWLRLKTSRITDNIFLAPNTLTQRMTGPECEATVCLDVSALRDGDVCGLSAFNGDAALLSIAQEGKRRTLQLSFESVELTDPGKRVTDVKKEVIASVPVKAERVWLRIHGDFNLGKDLATFAYSTDGKTFRSVGKDFKMRFDFRRFFMGTKFAIYCYATRQAGGWADVDSFILKQK